MDLKGSLVNTNLKIYPTKKLLGFLESMPLGDDIPVNILKLVKDKNHEVKNVEKHEDTTTFAYQLNNEDINNLLKIKKVIDKIEADKIQEKEPEDITEKSNNNQIPKEKTEDVPKDTSKESIDKEVKNEVKDTSKESIEKKMKNEIKQGAPYLTTTDIDWLYDYLQRRKSKGDKDVPYLHVLLEGVNIEMPDNRTIKRNPVLEARCVKLRAQQEARDYRKMTKSVDNVRMRFPEDSISYQLKQINRQLIAIGQFIISIFAGFLFGFKGVEWMVGYLDFGFKLLLGVMCALIIALAEIYFLAKKLNEELNIPETVQLGGPPKFANETNSDYYMQSAINKEHQD